MQSLDSSIEIRDIRRRLYATAELWTRTPPNVHRRFLHVKSCRWHRTSCTVPVCTGMPVNMHRNRCPGIRKLARQLPVLYQRMPPTVCTFEQLVVRPTVHISGRGIGWYVMFHTVTLKRPHSNSWNASGWNIPLDLLLAEKLLRSSETSLVKGRDCKSQSCTRRDASRCRMPQDVPYRGQAQV